MMGKLPDTETWEQTMLAGVAAKVAEYAELLAGKVDAATLPALLAAYQTQEIAHERKRRADAVSVEHQWEMMRRRAEFWAKAHPYVETEKAGA